jgi:hypothetical protein
MTYQHVLDSVPLAATRLWCGHNGRVTACDKCQSRTVPWVRGLEIVLLTGLS